MIHHVKQSEVVAYSPFEMFELVADLDHYKNFLPWCSGSEVLERKNGEVLAVIQLAYVPVKAAFTTRNKNHPNEYIKMRLVRRSLRHFEGSWHFEGLRQGGRVAEELVFGEISQVMEQAHQRVRGILSAHRNVLDDLAHLVSQNEMVQGDGLRKMLGKTSAE